MLTLQKLRDAQRLLAAVAPPRPVITEIVVTRFATVSGDRLFLTSRHRSARTHKKLVKRFGGVFARKPSCFLAGTIALVHPALAARLVDVVPARTGAKLWAGIPIRYVD